MTEILGCGKDSVSLVMLGKQRPILFLHQMHQILNSFLLVQYYIKCYNNKTFVLHHFQYTCLSEASSFWGFALDSFIRYEILWPFICSQFGVYPNPVFPFSLFWKVSSIVTALGSTPLIDSHCASLHNTFYQSLVTDSFGNSEIFDFRRALCI